MESIKFVLAGTAPFVMHSPIGADPLDPRTIAHKKLTSVRKKTDENHRQIARSEYGLAFYDFDPKVGPVIPGRNIHKAIMEGGTASKNGKLLKEAMMVMEKDVQMQYKGPKDIDGLWAMPNDHVHKCPMRMKTGSTVIRYRPMFPGWKVEFELAFDDTRISREDVIAAVHFAGRFKGLGTSRPEFGRFTVKELK